MSSVDHIQSFLHRVTRDANLSTTHIGVCAALVVAWSNSGFINPFSISRKKLMDAARIKSTSTYHKIIADLRIFKYIEYSSSYHPIEASKISIL